MSLALLLDSTKPGYPRCAHAFMRDAVGPFAEALRQVDFGPTAVPVLGGLSAAAVGGNEQAVELL